MGLDIYLYHCLDRKTAKAAEENYETESESNWQKRGGYSAATESQKAEIKAENEALATTLLCTGQYNCYHTVNKVEQDSSLHPEHMFKVGYFRSSYNSGGINSYFRQFGIPDLYDIFEPNEEYEFTPNWEASLIKVNTAIALYESQLAGPVGDIRITKVSANVFGDGKGPSDEKEAMKIVEAEAIKQSAHKDGFKSYSNAQGDFAWDGLEVVAMIMGTDKFLKREHPCCYIAYRQKKEKPEEKDWYLQALEVVRETIQYVLGQSDPQNYYFHWSG